MGGVDGIEGYKIIDVMNTDYKYFNNDDKTITKEKCFQVLAKANIIGSLQIHAATTILQTYSMFIEYQHLLQFAKMRK